MICARRTSPAPSFCERVIRASLCASSSLNPRTRSVIATSPAWTRAPCNAPDPEKSHPTCRMHHLARLWPFSHHWSVGRGRLLVSDIVQDAAVEGSAVDREGEARVFGDALWIAAPPRQHVERDLLQQLTIDRHDDATAHREVVGLAEAPGKGQALRCARLQLLINQPYLGLA